MFQFNRSLMFSLLVISFICFVFLSPVLMLAIGGVVAWTVAIVSLAISGVSGFSLCVESY